MSVEETDSEQYRLVLDTNRVAKSIIKDKKIWFDAEDIRGIFQSNISPLIIKHIAHVKSRQRLTTNVTYENKFDSFIDEDGVKKIHDITREERRMRDN